MISKELAKKIRLIQISTRKNVTNVFAGEYESAFKGQGMEFEEVREYQAGDDVKSIDWNVTARSGTPHIKRFREERELTVFFLIDLSASGTLASFGRSKNETAAEICALLAMAASRNNDKIGLVGFTDTIELFIPPGKGSRHIQRLVRDILSFKPGKKGTDIAAALDFLGRLKLKHSIIFLLSDFQDTGWEKPFSITARKHDLAALFLQDPRERELPPSGLIHLVDAESSKKILIDCSSSKLRRKFKAMALEKEDKLKRRIIRNGGDFLKINTKGDYVHSLSSFFLKRERRGHGT